MIVVFGSINLDLIFNVPRIPASGETVLGPATRIEPGGKGANQAVAAARDGGQVKLTGAIGTDSLADGTLPLLQDAGVDLSRLRRIEGVSTGCAAIVVDPAANNAIAVGSGANLSVSADQVEDALLRTGTTLVLQMEVPAAANAALIAHARAAGCQIVLNLAPAAALPASALQAVDVLVVNETEAAWLAAEQGCAASAMGLHAAMGGIAVVVTLGAEGADVADKDGSTWHEPALAVTAVDTTAAGDCFVGVLANRLNQGAMLREAVRQATRSAGICCTRAGSQGSIPWAAELSAA